MHSMYMFTLMYIDTIIVYRYNQLFLLIHEVISFVVELEEPVNGCVRTYSTWN